MKVMYFRSTVELHSPMSLQPSVDVAVRECQAMMTRQ